MNEESFVKISTNWELLHGKIVDTLFTKVLEPDSSSETEISDLADIASLDRSIHLQEISTNGNANNESGTNECEISLEIFPRFLAHNITLITDCQKMEIFINFQDEYLKTVYGEMVDDFDGMKVYRFDIVLDEKLGCVKILLKLISKSPNIWIYGIQLQIQANPNKLQTIFSQPNINLENVQSMLINSNQKLSPGAERCKAFLANYMRGSSSTQSKACLDYSAFLNCSSSEWLSQNQNKFKPTLRANLSPSNLENESSQSSDSFNIRYLEHNDLNVFKEFVLNKILESENRIFQKLEEIEQKQDEKLNKILKLLEK